MRKFIAPDQPPSEIFRVTIKSSSGYVPGDMAYNDKITITSDSISYEYKPLIESNYNTMKKWSYKTNSRDFCDKFQTISKIVSSIISSSDIIRCADAPEIEFSITYTSKIKVSACFFTSPYDFYECFDIIRTLVPQINEMPPILQY